MKIRDFKENPKNGVKNWENQKKVYMINYYDNNKRLRKINLWDNHE